MDYGMTSPHVDSECDTDSAEEVESDECIPDVTTSSKDKQPELPWTKQWVSHKRMSVTRQGIEDKENVQNIQHLMQLEQSWRGKWAIIQVQIWTYTYYLSIWIFSQTFTKDFFFFNELAVSHQGGRPEKKNESY